MQYLEKPQVRFGEWISEGWKMFTEQWKAWVLNTLIYALICFTPMIVVIFGFYGYLFTQIKNNPRSAQPIPTEAILTFYLIFFAVMFVTLFVAAFFTGGMHQTALKQLRGGKVELRDLFSGGKYYFPILISSLLGGILSMIGAILCIVPAFLVGGCLFFTLPLIVERRLGAVEAMKTSYELTKRNIWMFALFAFVVQLIAQAGSYACYVGLLATIPLLFTITAVAYRDTFGLEGARYFRPNAPAAPGGYAQPLANEYQPPAPGYGQPGFTPYAGPEYGQPQPPRPMTDPFSPPEPAPPVAHPEPPALPVESAEPPKPQFDATVPLSNIPAPPVAPVGLTCSNCGMALPDTAGFCPRCGTRVER
jgi:hypothetical protein